MKYFSFCLCHSHGLDWWISICISSYCSCSWYFVNYTIFCPSQVKFYFSLIKGKSRNLQKLLKYFNRATTSVFDLLLSSRIFPVIFVLYSKDLLVIFLLLFILKLLASLFSLAVSFTSCVKMLQTANWMINYLFLIFDCNQKRFDSLKKECPVNFLPLCRDFWEDSDGRSPLSLY